jgi:hypothetical protein
MVLAGGVAADAVVGTSVGVSVGGAGVSEGRTFGVGGIDVGTLVSISGVPAVTQPASKKRMRLNKMGKEHLLIIIFSFDQTPIIIDAMVMSKVPGGSGQSKPPG